MGNRLGIQRNLGAAVVISLSMETAALDAAAVESTSSDATGQQTSPPASEQQITPVERAEFATASGSYSPYTPYGRQYALMREELARYRALSDGEHWRPLTAGQTLAPGVRDPRVKELRSLLMLYGDLPTANDMATAALDEGQKSEKSKAAAELFDADVRRAVERFQRRHGLNPDGVVDRTTREHLNTPPARRLATLQANLERWEKMPKDLGPRHIVVNIPEFTLRVLEGEQEQYRMRVVVGKPKHQTPQLSTRLTRVVFNPTWTVPRNIALRELLPKGSANLSAKGYRLVNNSGKSVPFSGRNLRALRLGSVALRQRGGEGNALGRLKFIIPNQHAIFLHDTQMKNLFSRSTRAYSHGCIRLEKPQEFAQLVLANQGSRPGKWNAERLTRYTSGSRTRAVELDQPIPVHIVYWTAWVDEEGLLNFRPDIYHRDQPAGSTAQ